METAYGVILLGFLGLVFGSFAGAQVWRLRHRQLLEDKAAGESYDKKELTRLEVLKKTASPDRSRCLECGHALRWYDLLPLVSWVSTGGVCRYCKKPIGVFEPTIELGTAALFVGSYLLWPYGLTSNLDMLLFIAWLCAIVLMVILFAYDKKWFLLPDRINFSLMAVAMIFAVLRLAIDGVAVSNMLSLAGSVGIMSGIYLLLYLYSKGRWIGFGDVKLGVGLGLLLGTWQLAFLALFLANLIGTLLVLPGLVRGTMNRQSEIPFGPLLIAGTIISVLLGNLLIEHLFRLTLTSF